MVVLSLSRPTDVYQSSMSGTLEDFSGSESNHLRWTGVYNKNGYNIKLVVDYTFAPSDALVAMTYRFTNLGNVVIRNVTFLR